MSLFVASRIVDAVRRVSVGALLLLAFSAPVSSRASEDWPRWRNSGFDGTAHGADVFRAPFRLEVRWRRSLGSGYSGVVIASGRAVTMFSDGDMDHLVALEADSGDVVWQVPIAPTYRGRDGANDGPVSTPAIADGTVYAVGPHGDVLAVDLGGGEELWRVHLARDFQAPVPHWGFAGSPLVVGKRLIVPAGGAAAGTILALDRRTGERVWQAGSDDVSYQSPMLVTVAGRKLVLAAGDHVLFAVDPASGAERWRMDHGGEGFYRRIINPVRVDRGGLLLTYRPDEARLIRLEGRGGELHASDAWSTPDLKLNYATPVHHRGHLYGYSGGLLVSVDARNGSLNWKSRPPGTGFPILIGDHLVVLTKKGTLHVIDADPQAYRERARLVLFQELAWTPPSFADGRVFARDSFTSVACVDVVPSDEVAAPFDDAPAGRLPDSRFGRFVRSLEGAPDRVQRVARFLTQQETFPLIEDGRLVHLIYVGDAEDLAVRGDMLETGEAAPMHRVEGTDLHTFSFALEPDARINYQFVRDLEETLPDPRNPRQSDSLLYPGTVSQLLMPESSAATVPGPEGKDLRGRIETFTLDSPPVQVGANTWGGEREVHVYLPPGYDEGSRRYPSLYVLYGKQMLDVGMASLLDERIGRGLPPLIVVFVESISPYEYARSQQRVHGRMIVDQLVPRVDATYRTSSDAGRRAILGVDEGGFSALELALREPEVFGLVVAQSVYPVGAGDEELLRLVAETPVAGSPRIWLDWGRYDQRSAVRRIDIAAFNRELRDRLTRRGMEITAREWNDGSDLLFWTWRAVETIQGIFGR